MITNPTLEQIKWSRESFWDKYKTQKEREDFLKSADTVFINKLIDATGNSQAKIYLSSFIKQDKVVKGTGVLTGTK